jgi:hypothetical protein
VSSPFRSEVGQLQEQLRRAEERIAAVENERATLERQLLRGRTRYGWLIVVLAAAVVSGFVGYTLSASPAAKRQAEAAAREARDRSELAEKKFQVEVCEADAKAGIAQYEACNRARVAQTKRLRVIEGACLSPTQKFPLCMCEPGDPLCSCL